MDIDFVLGTAADQLGLTRRAALGPQVVVSNSPLAAIETILANLGASGRLGRLRIFNCTGASSSFLTAQLVRLRGLFASDGRVQIFAPSDGGPSEPSKLASAGGLAGFQGGFQFGFQGGFQVGFQGGFQVGFQGGFQSGNFGGRATEPAALQLSSLLNVPVEMKPL